MARKPAKAPAPENLPAVTENAVSEAEALDALKPEKAWLKERQEIWTQRFEAQGIDSPKKRAMLAAMAIHGTVCRSAESARISVHSHYSWLEKDAVYAAAWAEAKKAACETLEQEARRRAILGVLEPVYQQGRMVGYKRVHSDTLLIFLMKGNQPDKFGDAVLQRHVHSGEVNVRFPDLERSGSPVALVAGRVPALRAAEAEEVAK